MSFKIMPKEAFPDWVECLCSDHQVIGPKIHDDHYAFESIHAASEIDLGYSTTLLPPKKALMPQKETLFTFNSGSNELEANIVSEPTVLLGVHTCDLHAIALLDRVFERGYPDGHYLSRRKNTTLVSVECLQPCSDQAFCKSMGTLSVPDEFDLHLTDLGNDIAIEIGSAEGALLLEGFPAVREARQVDYPRLSRVISDKWPRFPYRLDFDVTELPSLVSLSYRSVIWDKLGERCLSCGMCTLVCPTCYCFNTVDEIDLALNSGSRTRMWDSCQLDRFALVADGHNFRANRSARLRHRFMHKAKYQSDTFGMVGCVGCGRCAQACLVHISPVDTFNELYHKRAAANHKKQEVAL